MSVRKPTASVAPDVAKLQNDLNDLKQAAIAAAATDGSEASGAEASPDAPSFDSLTKTEQACAKLGVHPDAWKPIGFMNSAHYDQLMKSNKLDADLARRIESYKAVASSSR